MLRVVERARVVSGCVGWGEGGVGTEEGWGLFFLPTFISQHKLKEL